MKNPSDQISKKQQFLRDKIIGLGEHSIRKSYYPQLQQQLEEVDHARREIAESEARYRYLVENINDVILTLRPDGVVSYISPACLNLGGIVPDEVIGTPFIDLIHGDDRISFLEETGKPNVHSGVTEFRLQGRNEEYRHVRFSFRFAREKPIGITGVLSDITALKLGEIERKKLRDQLAQTIKMESIGRLAGGVAHDFNNLLGVIMGNAELTLDTVPKESQTYGDIQEILKTAERASVLTRQLLAFARKQAINPKMISLNETIASLLKMINRLLGENIELEWKPSKQDVIVKMDPSQVDQILVNLCINARDAIADTGHLMISTHVISVDNATCQQDGLKGRFAQVSVKDDGSGIEKEIIDQIFEPFFTTKEMGKGTGLGLSTVYGIAKQNGGFVTVESTKGIGTTFHVHIPLVEREIMQPVDSQKSQSLETGNETILLVEDETNLLKMTERALTRLGYTVIAEQNPVDAISNIESYKGSVDLLLTDLVMPQMNGIAMARKIAEIRPDLKQMFMSGYTDHPAITNGEIDRVTQFLQKPFSIRDLAGKVRCALDATP
ncbi:MAG: response regulator [Pontiellaceae bacterium]|nr:response regulator [Pontiellaceae bacterium]MBN2785089.1 response regulator [Pontiellaceae bacterium]